VVSPVFCIRHAAGEDDRKRLLNESCCWCIRVVALGDRCPLLGLDASSSERLERSNLVLTLGLLAVAGDSVEHPVAHLHDRSLVKSEVVRLEEKVEGLQRSHVEHGHDLGDANLQGCQTRATAKRGENLFLAVSRPQRGVALQEESPAGGKFVFEFLRQTVRGNIFGILGVHVKVEEELVRDINELFDGGAFGA